MHDLITLHSLDISLQRGRQFLSRRQRDDGSFVDYALAPGAAVAWPTALAGLALAADDDHHPAVEAAQQALLALVCPRGWAYNTNTACDADSSAWALRLLATGSSSPPPATVLEHYLDPSGHAHTFVPADRFGTWGDSHPDVTAVVGLALVECAAPAPSIHTVRRAIEHWWRPDRGWPCFWWTTTTYSSARCLELLAATGGIPSHIIDSETRRLGSLGAATTVFESAQRLAAAVALGARRASWAARAARELQAAQLGDGGWPPSATLRVPSQRGPGLCTVHADLGRVMGSAHALLALHGWRECQLPSWMKRSRPSAHDTHEPGSAEGLTGAVDHNVSPARQQRHP